MNAEFTLLGFSFMAASRCEKCEREMVGASSHEWACVNEDCESYNLKIHTGIYPAEYPKEKGDGDV